MNYMKQYCLNDFLEKPIWDSQNDDQNIVKKYIQIDSKLIDMDGYARTGDHFATMKIYKDCNSKEECSIDLIAPKNGWYIFLNVDCLCYRIESIDPMQPFVCLYEDLSNDMDNDDSDVFNVYDSVIPELYYYYEMYTTAKATFIKFKFYDENSYSHGFPKEEDSPLDFITAINEILSRRHILTEKQIVSKLEALQGMIESAEHLIFPRFIVFPSRRELFINNILISFDQLKSYDEDLTNYSLKIYYKNDKYIFIPIKNSAERNIQPLLFVIQNIIRANQTKEYEHIRGIDLTKEYYAKNSFSLKELIESNKVDFYKSQSWQMCYIKNSDLPYFNDDGWVSNYFSMGEPILKLIGRDEMKIVVQAPYSGNYEFRLQQIKLPLQWEIPLIYYYKETTNESSNFEDGLLQNKIQKSKHLMELESLIGLTSVKKEIQTLTNFIKIQQEREKQGLKSSSLSYHCVFTGNPGTGKTTVTRIVADIYKELGVLRKGHLVETDRAGLVAEYVGQTAVKTNKIIDSALDGVLFIDEAYSLIGGGENDYGKEAIATLLKRMEDDRDRLVVILAGYTKEMKDFIDTNPGLQSRFNRYIEFPDYTAEELYQIFELNMKKFDYRLADGAKEQLMQYFEQAVANKDKNFGNGRFVRNTFEKVLEHQANRLASVSNLTTEQLSEITIEDLLN